MSRESPGQPGTSAGVPGAPAGLPGSATPCISAAPAPATAAAVCSLGTGCTRSGRSCLPFVRQPDQTGRQVLQQMSCESPGQPGTSAGVPGAPAGLPGSTAPCIPAAPAAPCGCCAGRLCLRLLRQPGERVGEVLRHLRDPRGGSPRPPGPRPFPGPGTCSTPGRKVLRQLRCSNLQYNKILRQLRCISQHCPPGWWWGLLSSRPPGSGRRGRGYRCHR
jgi:hypothetical protein